MKQFFKRLHNQKTHFGLRWGSINCNDISLYQDKWITYWKFLHYLFRLLSRFRYFFVIFLGPGSVTVWKHLGCNEKIERDICWLFTPTKIWVIIKKRPWLGGMVLVKAFLLATEFWTEFLEFLLSLQSFSILIHLLIQ